MKKTRKKIEIIRLEERVLFDAAAAAAVVEAAEQQNDIQDQQNQQEQQLQEQQDQQAQQQQEQAENAVVQTDADGAAQPESAQTPDEAEADADGAERSEVGDAVDAMSNDEDLSADEESEIGDAEALQESVDAAAAEYTDAAVDALINGEDAEESEDAIAPADDDDSVSPMDAQDNDADTLAEEAAGLAPDAENAVEETAHHELAIISNTVADQDALISRLADGTDVLVLDDSSDVLDQINEYLDQHDYQYDAIHVLSHGGNGYFTLNNTVIDMQTLADDPASFAALGEHLTADGDILLYGCNIAGNADGQAFASQLASLTGADVAASTDRVGVAGGWSLEYSTGLIDVTAFAADDYAYNMASYTIAIAKQGTYVDTSTDIYSYSSSGQLLKNGTAVENVGRVDWVANQAVSGDSVSVDAKLTTSRNFEVTRSIYGTWSMSIHNLTMSSGESIGAGYALSVTAKNIRVTGDLSAAGSASISLSASDTLSFTPEEGADATNLSLSNASISLSGAFGFNGTFGTIDVSNSGTSTLTISTPSTMQTLNVDTLYVHNTASQFNLNVNGLHVITDHFHLHSGMEMDASTLTINADNNPDDDPELDVGDYTTWHFSCFAKGALNTTGTVEYLNGYSTLDDSPDGVAEHVIDLAPGTQNNVILDNGNYRYAKEYIDGLNGTVERVSGAAALTVTTFSGGGGDATGSDTTLVLKEMTGDSTKFSKTVSYTGRDYYGTTNSVNARGLDVTYDLLSGNNIYGGFYYNLTLMDTDDTGKNTCAYNITSDTTVANELTIDTTILFVNINSGKLTTNVIVDTDNATYLPTYRVASGATWVFSDLDDKWTPAGSVSRNATVVHGNINNSGTMEFYRDNYEFSGLVTNMKGGTIKTSENYFNPDKVVSFDNFSNEAGAKVDAYWNLRIMQMQQGWTNYGTLSYDVENFGFEEGIHLILNNAVGATISIHCGDTALAPNRRVTEYVFGTSNETGTRIDLTNSGTVQADHSGVVVFRNFKEGTGETAKYIVNKTDTELLFDGVMYFELDTAIAGGIYGSITNNGAVLNLNTAEQQYYGAITTKGVAPGESQGTSSATLASYGVTNINAKSIFRGTFTANEYSKITVGTQAAGTDYRTVIQPAVARWYQLTPDDTTVANAGETTFINTVTTDDTFTVNANKVVFEGTLTVAHKFTISGNNTEFKKAVTINSTSLEGGTLFSFGSENVTGTVFANSVTVGSKGTLMTELLLNSTATFFGTLTNSGNVTVTHDGVIFDDISNSSSGEFNLNSANNIFNGIITNSGHFYLNDVNPWIGNFSNGGYLWINESASNGVRLDGYLYNRSAFKNLTNSGTVTIRGEVDFGGTYENSGTTNLYWGGVRFLSEITNASSGVFNVSCSDEATIAGSTKFVFGSAITNKGTFKLLSVAAGVTFNGTLTNSGTFDANVMFNTGSYALTNTGTFNINAGNSVFNGTVTNSGTMTVKTGVSGVQFKAQYILKEGGKLYLGGEDTYLKEVSNSGTIYVTGGLDSDDATPGNKIANLKMESGKTLQSAIDVSGGGELTLVSVDDDYSGSVQQEVYSLTTTIYIEGSDVSDYDPDDVSTQSDGSKIVITTRKMTADEVEQYKAGTFPPEDTETEFYKVTKSYEYVAGMQPLMTVSADGLLHFDSSVKQTVYSHVEVSGEGDVLYTPGVTEFKDLTYLDWTVIYGSQTITAYGKYQIASGGSATVASDVDGARFRVMSGGSLTVNDGASDIDSVNNRGGRVTINGGTIDIALTNSYGTMVLNGGTFDANAGVINAEYGDLTISGNNFTDLTVVNAGTLTVSGSGNTLTLGNSGTASVTGTGNTIALTNTGTFDMNVDGTFSSAVNFGTFNIAADRSVIFTTFNDDAGGSYSPALNLGENAIVTFSAGTQTVNGSFAAASGATVNGALTLNGTTSGSGVTFNDNVIYSGNQNVIGGTYKGTLTGISASNAGTVAVDGAVQLGINSGTITAAGNVAVSTSNSGTITATGDNTTVAVAASSGKINISGVNVALSGDMLNGGSVSVKGNASVTSTMTTAGGSSVSVEKDGILTLNGTSQISRYNAVLKNRGTVNLAVEIGEFGTGFDNNGGTIVLNHSNIGSTARRQLLSGTGGTVVVNTAFNLNNSTITQCVTVKLMTATGVTLNGTVNNGTLDFYADVNSNTVDNTNGTLAFHINKTLSADVGGKVIAGANHTLTLDGVSFANNYEVEENGTLRLSQVSTALSGTITNNGWFDAYNTVTFSGTLVNNSSGTIMATLANFTGSVTNDGAIVLNNRAYFSGETAGNGTVDVDYATYTGNAAHVFGGTYGNLSSEFGGLTVADGCDATLAGDAEVYDFTLDGTLKTAAGAALTLKGAVNGTGTMEGGKGTVIYDGTDQNVIAGTYCNLTVGENALETRYGYQVGLVIGNEIAIEGNAVNNSGRVIVAQNVSYSGSNAQQVMAGYYGTLTLKDSGIKLMASGETFNVGNFNINSGNYVEVNSSGSEQWILAALPGSDTVNVDIHNAKVSDVNAQGGTYHLDGTNFQGTNNSANWLVFYSGSNVGETAPSMENANFNALSRYFYQTRMEQMNAHELMSRYTPMESARNVSVRDMAVGSDITLNEDYDIINFNRSWDGFLLAEDEIGDVLNSADAAADSFDEALAELLK